MGTARRQEAGGRRQETGDRRQEAGGRLATARRDKPAYLVHEGVGEVDVHGEDAHVLRPAVEPRGAIGVSGVSRHLASLLLRR